MNRAAPRRQWVLGPDASHELLAIDGVPFADLTEGKCFGGGRGGGRCLVTAASTPWPSHILRPALPATLCFIHFGRSWQREMGTKKFLRLSRRDFGLFAAKICFKPHTGLRDGTPPSVFAPGLQFPRLGPWAAIMIHRGTPHAVTSANVKARLSQKFPGLIMEFNDFRGRIQEGLVQERIIAIISGFFGGLSTIFATVGLYGVVSFVVARRRSEIGIRVALGARKGQVIRMVIRDTVRLLVLGLAIGVALSLAATRAASNLLFGIEPSDPPTLVAAVALLAAIAVGASFVPARRAVHLEPLDALRHE